MTTVLIKVMADYGCSPLWLSNDDGGRNLELDELELSADLVAGLQAWADTYDATLDLDDPASAARARTRRRRCGALLRQPELGFA